MSRYEYIRLRLDFGDLSELNRYSGDGWRVVATVPMDSHNSSACDRIDAATWLLMEREI